MMSPDVASKVRLHFTEDMGGPVDIVFLGDLVSKSSLAQQRKP